MNKEVILLKKIQDIDFKRDELLSKKKSLPQIKKMNDLKKEFAKSKRVYSLKKAELNDEAKKQRELDGQLELLVEKINKEDKKLYGGSIKNPKELMDIQKEIKSLKEKRDNLELSLLEVLEGTENLEDELKNLVKSLKRMKEENDVLMTEHKLVVTQIDEAFQDETAKRDELTACLKEDVLSLYESLCEKDSLAVADLQDGVCQGCFVGLPFKELDKILSSDRLWRCSHCERILYYK